MANLQKERYTRPIFKEMVASNGLASTGERFIIPEVFND